MWGQIVNQEKIKLEKVEGDSENIIYEIISVSVRNCGVYFKQ